MKEFTVIIKSHCEAPDYEDSVFAASRLKAAQKLADRMNFGAEEPIGVETILENMDEEGDN
jgi:hypothetical protein